MQYIVFDKQLTKLSAHFFQWLSLLLYKPLSDHCADFVYCHTRYQSNQL